MVELEKQFRNLELVHQARPETKLTFINHVVVEQFGGSSVLKTGGSKEHGGSNPSYGEWSFSSKVERGSCKTDMGMQFPQ